MRKLPLIRVGDQVFGSEGGEEFGAVRAVAPGGAAEIVVYIEGTGDVRIPLEAVASVHDGKVILELPKLSSDVRRAVSRAHVNES